MQFAAPFLNPAAIHILQGAYVKSCYSDERLLSYGKHIQSARLRRWTPCGDAIDATLLRTVAAAPQREMLRLLWRFTSCNC